LATVKAVASEQQHESQTSAGKHNYGIAESELLVTLDAKIEGVHEALCDSFNTPKAVTEIRALVAAGNAYYADKMRNKSVPNAHVLVKVAGYVTTMMRTFGVFEDKNPLVGTFAVSFTNGSTENVMPFVQALSSFRDAVRTLAQGGADAKTILALCDRLRDEDMVELGVSLEDRDGIID
jgi:cysteinyl-tRNA synthetase